MRPAVQLARRLAAERPSVIYSSAPPLSPHLAARRTKRAADIPLVLEFRDPWVDNPQKPAHVRSQLTDWLDARLERKCLEAADLVVSVSSGIDRLMSRKLPAALQDKCVMIRNGIDGLTAAPPLPPRPFRIMHAGTCSYGRDPRQFLRTLAAAVKRLGLGPADVEVHFVGMCRAFAGDDLATLAASLGLGGMLHLDDWGPRDTALRLMSESHLLLVLAQEQPDQVPNKVYECLAPAVRCSRMRTKKARSPLSFGLSPAITWPLARTTRPRWPSSRPACARAAARSPSTTLA
ncbi:MAG: glycosyltransferase [Gemmatimonadetes bacterium]|nr:glycosyltransferase [Gemmatimonadota bacterium]